MITHTPLVASNLPIKSLVAMAMTNNWNYYTRYSCGYSVDLLTVLLTHLQYYAGIHCVANVPRVCTIVLYFA